MDMYVFQNNAKFEQTGLNVSSLNIAHVKQKYDIIEREIYNN